MSRYEWVNIEGLEPVNDTFYRYQMPKLRGHAEKSWTVLPFFEKTASALHRNQEEVLKFLGLTLHTQTKFDQGRACIKGHFSDGDVHLALRRYIEGFVLCGECKKPETAYRVRRTGAIIQKCFACGHKTHVESTPKLCNFILAEYRKTKARQTGSIAPDAAAGRRIEKPRKKTKSTDFREETKSLQTFESISDEAAMEEAVDIIREAMQTGCLQAPRLARRVAREQRAFALMPREKIRLLIGAASTGSATNLFEEDVYETLGLIVEESEMMRGYMEGYVISCMEEIVSPMRKGGVQFVGHLKACYEEGVLAEETIVAWWKGECDRTTRLVDVTVRERLQRVSTPLIEWLAHAEGDDS